MSTTLSHGPSASEETTGGSGGGGAPLGWDAHRRGEALLLRHCRAGHEEALTVLGYALADTVYAAVRACLRQGDTRRGPAAAREALDLGQSALDAALRRLGGWTRPSVAELRAVALARLGLRPRSLEGVGPPPLDFAEALAARAREAGPALLEATRRHSFWRLQGYAVVAALALSIVVMLFSYQTLRRVDRVPPAVLEGIQFRVRHSGMATMVRDMCWDIPDPDGSDRWIADAMDEAALFLDEIATLSPKEARERLPYMAARLRRAGVVEALQYYANRGPARTPQLDDVCLTLEEVENCFGSPSMN